MGECLPVGVFLQRTSINGDKLLFKYPFEQPKDSRVNARPRNPYATDVSEDDTIFMTKSDAHSNNVLTDNVITISDKDLSTLFACQGSLSQQKFELKVNNIRFIGHPHPLNPKSNKKGTKCCGRSQCKDCKGIRAPIINVVFAVTAYGGQDIVKQYHELSKRIAVAIANEERKNEYFSKEYEKIVDILDNYSDVYRGYSESHHLERNISKEKLMSDKYEKILLVSDLALTLQRTFKDLCTSDILYFKMNGSNLFPFRVPERIRKFDPIRSPVQANASQRCVEQVKPYHALLLVVTPEELLASVNSEYRRAYERLNLCASATKSMIELGYDTDITLESVMELTLPLVEFAHAIVIFPVRATNRYVLAPNAPTRWNHPLVKEFSEQFCDMSLPAIQSEFSMPTSISHIYNPQIHDASYMEKLQDIVIWCLQKRILMQVHIYVYLVIPDSSTENTLNWHKSGNTFSEYRENTLMNTNEKTPVKPEKRNEDDIEEFPTIWKNLTDQQKKHIEDVPAFNNAEDRSLFLRCLVFFDGKNHIEHIMYSLNVTRSKLMHLIDKFQQVLVTVEHPDPAFDVFYN